MLSGTISGNINDESMRYGLFAEILKCSGKNQICKPSGLVAAKLSRVYLISVAKKLISLNPFIDRRNTIDKF